MKTSPLKQGTLIENSTGIGTVTRGMLRERAVQLAVISGHAAQDVSKTDWDQAEREFRLRGKGLPSGDGARGDLHAVVHIQIPPELTPEEKFLWEQLAAGSAFNPRESA